MRTFLLLLSILALGFAACNDKNDDTEDNSARAALILGTWNISATGTDANGNDQLEGTEQDGIPAGVTATQTFNAGGTGYVRITTILGSTDNAFTWVLQNDNTEVRSTATGGAAVETSRIITLTSTRLVAKVVSSNKIFVLQK